MTNLEKKGLSRILASVRMSSKRSQHGLGFIDLFAEDPAEFFSMIFGGDAFVDWYIPFSADLPGTIKIANI